MGRKLAVAAAMVVAAVAVVVGTAAAAGACGGLIGPNGDVRLLRTSTLAAYHGGVEHYVTSFEFAGGGAELGSIVPLPDVPTSVERGGDWTLQRLNRETRPALAELRAGAGDALAAAAPAEVILEARIDALDITVLKGGGKAVGDWAREHGFTLTPDAPEVLDFYAARSPVFMAARFDAEAARARGQAVGDGTPIHLTIPTDNPWVPLRILGLGRAEDEPVEADVYLLTDRRPALLPLRRGLTLDRSEPASTSLLDDLRADKGMEWIPRSMWLSFLRVDTVASRLTYDLAVDATGRRAPSLVDAGLRLPAASSPAPTTTPATAPPTSVTTTPVTSDPTATTAAPSPTTTLGGEAQPPLQPVSDGRSRPWLPYTGAVVLVGAAAAGLVARALARGGGSPRPPTP